MQRPPQTYAQQVTRAMRERDELEQRFKAESDARVALKLENIALKKRVRELESIAEGRKQVALEARRELTFMAKKHGVTKWTDARALAANDKDLTHAA